MVWGNKMTDLTADFKVLPRLQRCLIGHEGPAASVRRALESEKMPQAWLLSGMQGIGKATFAYQMSRMILKLADYDSGFIDRQIDSGSYPNLLVLEKGVDEDGKVAREITVDDVRAKLNPFLQQVPAVPGWRVVIIDAADDLNRNASNALLKSLEEPPAQTIFFLIAHSVGRLLPTIRSRCCTLSFEPVDFPGVHDLLTKAIACGSMGRYQQLKQFDVQSVFELFVEIVHNCLQGEFAKAQQFVATLQKADPNFAGYLMLLEWMLSRLVLVSHQTISIETPADSLLRPVCRTVAPFHFVEVVRQVMMFLNVAKEAHLDQGHLMMSVFFMIHNPALGEKVNNVA